MVNLVINVDNLSGALELFDVIQVRKYIGDSPTPSTEVTDLVALTEYATVSGTDTINQREYVSDVLLGIEYEQYYFNDPDGTFEDWYTTRYYNTEDYSTTGWSAPVRGDTCDIFYNPFFPVELYISPEQQRVVDQIRLWIGDPKGIRREFGEEAVSSIHPDNRTYELDERGWPISINMGGLQFTNRRDPVVNGYKYLRFGSYIDEVCTTCVTYSGICGELVQRDVTHGVDIWYHTFRNSDKKILTAYNNCSPPYPLTTANTTPEIYMLVTAIDLFRSELIEDATEDGAKIDDEGSKYDPTIGLTIRKKILDDLVRRLEDLIKAAKIVWHGVLID